MDESEKFDPKASAPPPYCDASGAAVDADEAEKRKSVAARALTQLPASVLPTDSHRITRDIVDHAIVNVVLGELPRDHANAGSVRASVPAATRTLAL